MPYILVHEKVRDFTSWKAGFEGNASMRQTAGSKGGQVFQNPDDPNEVVVLLEWDDLQKARDFASSPQLRQAMERSGVIGEPHIHVIEQAAQAKA
jgi:heme-degrading monooxygenase HmoA